MKGGHDGPEEMVVVLGLTQRCDLDDQHLNHDTRRHIEDLQVHAKVQDT
jgi:hypothetical protein